MNKPDLRLELTSEQMRSMVDQVMSELSRYIDTLDQQPAIDLKGARELALQQLEPLPESETAFSDLLETLFGSPARGLPGMIEKSFNTAGPGYLGYVPGGGLLHSAVADLIANAVNRYVGVFLPAPALTQLETNVIRWFCQIVDYPKSALGFLTSGGSMANLSAVITARSEKLPDQHHRGTVYCSNQTHHSLAKAVRLSGIPAANLRLIPVDSQFRLRPAALLEAIKQDRRVGFQPFLVVGNAGTTNTGAVDPLNALADITRDEDLWLHVDAAYGGFFSLTTRGREVLRGLERADSMVLDPHKSLFLPYGTGCLLARDRASLGRTFSSQAEYLPQMQDDANCVDFCEISPELSRDFRGLRVWLPLKMHGISPFRANLEEKLDLTHWLVEKLRTLPGIEICAEPQLSLFAFRLNPGGKNAWELNTLNRKLLEQINESGRVFLTGTMIDDKFLIRVCILSFRTHLDRIEAAYEEIEHALRVLR